MSPQPGAALASAPASTRPPEPMPVQADAATRHLADDRPAGATWGALALLLSLLAAAGALAPAAWQQMLDWQPGLVASQPWRAFSAIAVHYSAWHLVANLAGAAAVTALGRAAQLPARCTLAWALAWPMTQLGLLVQPALVNYGGLSGVLHAGVAVAALHLLWRARGARRAIGAALAVGLAAKLLGEAPWGAPLRRPADWDIALAPIGHATGVAAGVVSGIVVEAWRSARGPAVRA